jgi:hypothetical protein
MTPFSLRLGLLTALFAGGVAPPAHAGLTFRLLDLGKSARLENTGDPDTSGGTFRVGPDAALQPLLVPVCPALSRVDVSAYLQSTNRDAALASQTLDCGRWRFVGRAWRYDAASGPIRSIVYGEDLLRIDVGGPGYVPIRGPVAFVQVQLEIGDVALRARYHNFERNDGELVRSRHPTRSGALGESSFWQILSRADDSEANQQATLDLLGEAVQRDRRDGRSRFLLGMTHLYRFGQQVVSYDDVGDSARADAAAAVAWFDQALPLLWDSETQTGDSRVIGFAGAAKFTLGVVEDDAALQAQGLEVLDLALQVNPFFNVFDLIPVLQALPPGDPRFAAAYARVIAYLEDPETLGCVISQPELCANAGMAPSNISGSLTLFGDLYAKAGNPLRATQWYLLANALTPASWPFKPALAARLANVAGRVALYQDADPSNDPPILGAGAENCAVCHTHP